MIFKENNLLTILKDDLINKCNYEIGCEVQTCVRDSNNTKFKIIKKNNYYKKWIFLNVFVLQYFSRWASLFTFSIGNLKLILRKEAIRSYESWSQKSWSISDCEEKERQFLWFTWVKVRDTNKTCVLNKNGVCIGYCVIWFHNSEDYSSISLVITSCRYHNMKRSSDNATKMRLLF